MAPRFDPECCRPAVATDSDWVPAEYTIPGHASPPDSGWPRSLESRGTSVRLRPR